MGGDNDFAVVRYLSDGTPDPSFGNGGVAFVDVGSGSSDVATGLAIQPQDGKVVVCGDSDVNGDSDFAAARLDTNGNLDAAFGGGTVVAPLGREATTTQPGS